MRREADFTDELFIWVFRRDDVSEDGDTLNWLRRDRLASPVNRAAESPFDAAAVWRPAWRSQRGDTDEAEEQLGSQRSGCSSRLHPLTPPLQAGGAKGNSELR